MMSNVQRSAAERAIQILLMTFLVPFATIIIIIIIIIIIVYYTPQEATIKAIG